MKKQIYITALHLSHGGVEMAIALLSNAFVKKGYSVTVLSIYNLGEPAYYISPEVKIEYLTDVKPNRTEFKNAVKSKNLVKAFKEGLYSLKVLRLKKSSLIKRIKSVDEGIIISTRNEHSVLLSKYGKESVLKIAQLHHDHGFDKKLLYDIKNNYTNIDTFTLLTDSLTKEITEMLKGKNTRTKCVTMPNFLDTEDFSVDFAKKEKTVVAVGRLHPVKGFDRLLDIWADVAKDYPDWKLKIIGDGEEREKLCEKAKALSTENSVEFTGALSHGDVLNEMKRSSLYVMTSYSEGFGFVIIEAMSAGLPVAAFDVRVGPRAIIEQNKNGVLIKDSDFEEYKKALCDLMSNTEKREEFGKNAVERAKDFTEEKIVQKWLSIFSGC